MTVKPEHLNQLLHPQFSNTDNTDYKARVIAKGLPASPGAAVGKVVFSPEAAESAFAKGENCILVRDETSPEDVSGMIIAYYSYFMQNVYDMLIITYISCFRYVLKSRCAHCSRRYDLTRCCGRSWMGKALYLRLL